MAGREDWGSFASLRGREATSTRRKYAELMNSAPRPDYQGFARQASGMNLHDLSASTERKRELLQDYFPGRYAEHRWGEMDSLKIGSLLQKLYEYAKKQSQH